MPEHVVVLVVLLGSLVLFIIDRWRYDIVALAALFFLTLLGIVPTEEAFTGFAHPAVVTVVAVLVVSKGLTNSGLTDVLGRLVARAGSSPTAQVGALTGAVTVSSAFMNNVGALSVMLPLALRAAREGARSPAILLMPIAFGSLLGGMTTLIGTPPNIIVASFRSRTGQESFGFLDFAPVGVPVAVVGVTFLVLVGWRLIPRRGNGNGSGLFRLQDYTTELRVPERSPLIGRNLREFRIQEELDFVVTAVVRRDDHFLGPIRQVNLEAGDLIVIQADPDLIHTLVERTGFELEPAGKDARDLLGSDDVELVEAVVLPDSPLVGRSAERLRLRSDRGFNLLAVSRQGSRLRPRLKDIRFRPGDVILAQSASTSLRENLSDLRCLPLAERELRLGARRRLLAASLIMASALAALVGGVLPPEMAFPLAAMGMVLVGLVPLRDAYQNIDWPVVVLLGAMIPVGKALETTGGAGFVAAAISALAWEVHPLLTLAVVLVGTMFLSDLMNNAATAVVMAPIAISLARGLELSPDPFLMAVAVGASCAFLTPIGHQSNTLVMGPGGYRFGDYWRVGLPLEALITVVAVPLIAWAWPLQV